MIDSDNDRAALGAEEQDDRRSGGGSGSGGERTTWNAIAPRFRERRDGSVRGSNLPSSPTKDFLGSGWAFPPRLDNRGGIALVHHEQDIEEAVLLILRTRRGERPMRPEFGSELYRLVFEPNDATTAGLARRYVTEALMRWEPRIDQIDVVAAPDEERPERLLLEVTYRIRATNDIRNLVFPFYTIPGEE